MNHLKEGNAQKATDEKSIATYSYYKLVHELTIIVVGKNCIPPMKSANASSPKAKRKGDRPNVIPLINKICNAENSPFNNVVLIYTVRQLHLMKNLVNNEWE